MASISSKLVCSLSLSHILKTETETANFLNDQNSKI